MLAAGATEPASAALIGDAASYNVFVFGNGSFVSQNDDTVGDLAAGGDVSLMNYGVATGIAGNTSMTVNPARLVVGGTLTATNGGVGAGSQMGTIYTNNLTHLTSFTAGGGVKPQTVVGSFSADATVYQNLSSSLDTLTANGSATSSFGTLNLTGTATGLNVFTVSGGTLAASSTVNITAPTGSTVLINVTGGNVSLNSGQVNESAGLTAANVIYNFEQATTLNLGSTDPEGSVLAPDAGVLGGSGQFHGQLITGSFSGAEQFDSTPFAGTLPTVPLPASGWLLESALLAMGGLAIAAKRAKLFPQKFSLVPVEAVSQA